ncbi:MAG TPA: M55 family metallopeptidase [Candidatus Brocadiia bacterium]|nr:M55 family metallopeptidase [Candidatus Brocadiia bacterium]
MKVYISTDMEGISGVVVWEQAREFASPHYENARRLLMGDIRAAIQGCREGGARHVTVLDGHGGGYNFVPELMLPGAVYATGTDRRQPHMGLDESFAAGMLLGYHAMAGTPDGMLNHTQSSRSGIRYWYNGLECGEIAQSALVMGHFGVPVVMVTGDEATCREAKEFLGPEIVTVAVKKGYGRTCGELLAPEEAHALIIHGAREAVKRVDRCKPFRMDRPILGTIRFPDKQTADSFRPSRSYRVDDVTFEATFNSPLEIYFF